MFERRCLTVWTEDWFADYFDEHWSLFASRLAGASALGGPETHFGAYVVPRSERFLRQYDGILSNCAGNMWLYAGSAGWGFQMRVHSLLAHGAKAIKYFAFGPEWYASISIL